MGCRMTSRLLAGVFASAAMLFSHIAEARPVRCVITGSVQYAGKCDFIDGGGSFSLSPIGRASFPGGINPLSVGIDAPGVAEVRGLTRDGINSLWGEARRSKNVPACWEGSDFRICAY
jgi:hypothetical protein